jgi:hypothetical protein
MGNWSFSAPSLPVAAFLVGLLGVSAFSARVDAEQMGANTAAVVECITPDGQPGAISDAHVVYPSPAASMIDESTVSCPLREGNTTFVIALASNTLRDRFTFINQNAAACGQLTIAVADSRLPANSPEWTQVEGTVPFSHKRLFNLSVLGIETKFLRLTFHVEVAAEDSTFRRFVPQNSFDFSAVETAVISHSFTGERGEPAPVRSMFASLWVAPLCLAPNE